MTSYLTSYRDLFTVSQPLTKRDDINPTSYRDLFTVSQPLTKRDDINPTSYRDLFMVSLDPAAV
ncbi:hypothetical protein [Wolbachia endosymbiont of Aedes albopictus]|uniref:hypothetical protein n=1 Tax=Wolbachia endosymbiont of Aedes albopictus TaxID=167957 RepID=UPI002167E63E|nr:hypothetical protein [Wolbachia endosymbiont of Aedes albopictus]UVW83608.1 hypothetical protein NHG98_04495 [Wolbachia endosymbiont of Aedes albopictus]